MFFYNMISLIVIAILVILGFLFVKFYHTGMKIKLVLLLLLGLLLYWSISGLMSSVNLDVNSPTEVIKGVGLYFSWLGQTATHVWDIGKTTALTIKDTVSFNNTKT